MPVKQNWWEDFRGSMPVAETWAYFDHAAVAPISGPAQKAMERWLSDASTNGAVHWSAWRKSVEEARRAGAELLGATPEEIAVVRNTTEGINLVAEGFPWQTGDNVVTLTSEFPSNRYPWMNLARRGVETRLVATEDERVDLDRLAEACDQRTRIISVSWVGYATGWRSDVASLVEFAHQRGAFLFLDAIQGLGVFPLDLSEIPVDFLAADGHKWLLGPEGAGLFFIRKDHLDLLQPVGIGWNSVTDAGDFSSTTLSLKHDAGRYEGGSYNLAGTIALAANLDWLLSYGVRNLCERLLEVTDSLCGRLEAIGAEITSNRSAEQRSGIIACTLPERNPQSLKQQCLERNVVVNCRANRLRVSPHVYTNEEDIQRLIDALVSDA
jgi:selenocysteine lyase/cysteine desulfurase